MATKREILGTHQKALQVNLDPSKYGTFAEIGAGQEVTRWFFRVGAYSDHAHVRRCNNMGVHHNRRT